MKEPTVEKVEHGWNFDFGDLVVGVSKEQASTQAKALKIAHSDYANSKAAIKAADEQEEKIKDASN